jgi:hypothetical protein
MLWKWERSSISLSYSLPRDPAFAAFVMGVLSVDREIVFLCNGFHFVEEGKLAPVPTITGLMQREEPLFLHDIPNMHIK